VSERRADSIDVTELWFLVMKSPYMESHCGGAARALGTCREAVLRVSIVLDRVWDDELRLTRVKDVI
jgi:hypothetical protein